MDGLQIRPDQLAGRLLQRDEISPIPQTANKRGPLRESLADYNS